MKLIELTQGKFAQVDDEDYEYLTQYKWYAVCQHNHWYVVSWINKKNTKMHRLLLNLTNPDILADHKDSDGLNNQRNNLRISDKVQNGCNRKGKSSNSKSKYKGVSNKKGSWVAQLQYRGIRYNKCCPSENAAAVAYNELALKYHGEFARLNIIID